jgi:hypothetical protein
MRVAARRLKFLVLTLALGLVGSGCVYRGDSGDFLEGPGTPIGITALKIPFERLVTPPPPPAGFSSTYQKMLLDHQRLARKQAEREAQEKSSDSKPKDNADSAKKPAVPAS